MKLKQADGFLTVDPKPTTEELKRFYQEKYFASANANQYTSEYTTDELLNKRIDCEEAASIIGDQPSKNLLDIGCGEGFFMEYFSNLGWNVRGLDFTADGILTFHPHLKDVTEIGDLFAGLDNIIKAGSKFEFVSLNNVLEHVIYPLELLQKLRLILTDNGICRIRVPNDNSWLQRLIVEKGFGPQDYWYCAPEHLNYMSTNEFQETLENNGLQVMAMFGDFPIELFLLNQNSNYKADVAKGKAAHKARIIFENKFFEKDITKFLRFRKVCAEAGISRNSTAYVRLRK